jgi:hypothetical protein
MATWVMVGGCVVLALILGGAVLLTLVFTRGENDDDVHLPRFKRLEARSADPVVGPADDD